MLSLVEKVYNDYKIVVNGVIHLHRSFPLLPRIKVCSCEILAF